LLIYLRRGDVVFQLTNSVNLSLPILLAMENILGLERSTNNKPSTSGGTIVTKQSLLSNKIGLTIAGISVGTVVFLYGAIGPFITPALRRYCLPYVPATTQQVRNVMNCLQGRTGRLVDLGSGDGRIVLEAAKHGLTSVGVELNIWLVLYSRLQAWRSTLGKEKAMFTRQDMWTVDLSAFENIVIFGTEQLMPALESKFLKELKCGSIVVACRFPLPYWKPLTTCGDGIDKVWMYQMPMKY